MASGKYLCLVPIRLNSAWPELRSRQEEQVIFTNENVGPQLDAAVVRIGLTERGGVDHANEECSGGVC
jgi:hypothetical protein